ncbi:hypothetical protein M440DRAFT_1025603 [Trichoderma longibrachiatum ATCC 18648]|uniref:Uncharacterized protein n=1 Tax=Trichoderma longibrachiatum ATCC 18648 TaxID=983965 RepID=A0A2T4CK25_TRILO|nr:hypothetical protein M440DRAFT_1025603 [Trichoderma longibrachiatum ATCC 18648]
MAICLRPWESGQMWWTGTREDRRRCVSAKSLVRLFVLVFTAAPRHLGVVHLLIQDVLCSQICTKPRETDRDARARVMPYEGRRSPKSSRNCRRD